MAPTKAGSQAPLGTLQRIDALNRLAGLGCRFSRSSQHALLSVSP